MKAVKIPLELHFSLGITGNFDEVDIAELEAAKGVLAKTLTDEMVKQANVTPGITLEVTKSVVNDIVVVDL